jgi:hypothetical protein
MNLFLTSESCCSFPAGSNEQIVGQEFSLQVGYETRKQRYGDAPLLPGPNLYEDEPTSNVSCCAFPKRTPPTYTLTGFQGQAQADNALLRLLLL